MSAKKKSISACEKCQCTLLLKDFPKHVDLCGSAPNYWEMCLVKPRYLMKGTVVHVEMEQYLPPYSSGWLRRYSVLISPQAMDALGVTSRQPVRVQGLSCDFIGVLWPCKELGVLRVCVTKDTAPCDELISITPIWNSRHVQHLMINVNPPVPSVYKPLQEYIQMYLTNSYIQCGVPICLNYYGKTFEVTPDVPLNFAIENLSLEDGELESEIILFVATNCRISISKDAKPSSIEESSLRNFSSLSLIGGMHMAKKTLMNFVLTPFSNGESCCSVLLWGLPGSGKTLLLSAVAQTLKGCGFYCQSMDDFDEEFALIPPGSVVILDWTSVDKEHRGFLKLMQLLDDRQYAGVILSVRSAEELDLGVRVRFPVEVEVDVPMEEERVEILRTLTKAPDDVIYELAKRTHGFTGGDLQSLVIASRFSVGQSEEEKLENARKRVRPTGIRQFILEIPQVSWDDIGGCEELKLEIQQAVIWPQKHRDAFERFGIDPPSGILLYGPPGCSKTLIARALANESKMNFLAVKGPELFSKWVGESEKAIRDLFSRARQVAPAIVFFDEIDAVGGSRGSEKSSGVSDRVLAQLLTELDGLEKQSGVLLLAATNRPDQLDNALLRPGRLDRAIYVGLPCPETRRAIIQIRTKRMTLAENDIIDKLTQSTEGYSGAELVAVCQHAALLAMRENIEATDVRWSHFEASLTTIVPRTERAMLQVYERFRRGIL